MKKHLFVIFFILLSHWSFGQAQKGYHLFKAVPKDSLRDFSLDRPDVTESAQTVDAGHFQFEGDLIRWSKRNQGSSFRDVQFLNGLYKVGLTHNLDFHVVYELYNIEQNERGQKVGEGPGVFSFRMKYNVWGNDGDTKSNLGVLPYVSFLSGTPFDTSQDIEFGVGFPFAISINDRLDFGGQPQIDFLPDGNGGFDVGFFQAFVVGGQVVGALDFYLETVAFILPGADQYTLNGGLIYNVNPNLKIDIAANQGLNKVTPSNVYLGLSFRL